MADVYELTANVGAANGSADEALDAALTRIFDDIFGVETSALGDEQRLNDLREWDSLKHMEFVVGLEQEFGFQLTGDEIADMDTFGKVRTVVGEKLERSITVSS